MERASFAAYVQVDTAGGETIYTGEAIYRPRRPHPLTGAPSPAIGIPDASLRTRPDASKPHDIWFNGDRIPAAAIYLERVASCWWFVLTAPPRHPPTV